MTVRESAEALRAALRTVDNLRVAGDPTSTLDPPVAVLGPPLLDFEGHSREPTTARFPLYVIVSNDDRAYENLWDLVPLVTKAIEEEVQDAVVPLASPGVFDNSGTDLPSYELSVRVSL